MSGKTWRDEFDEKFLDLDLLDPEGLMFSETPHYSVIKAFIADLIEKERAAAVAEYQAKLNSEGLGEDEKFKEFCNLFARGAMDAYKR